MYKSSASFIALFPYTVTGLAFALKLSLLLFYSAMKLHLTFIAVLSAADFFTTPFTVQEHL
jgi:hypothetical protein